MVETGNNVGGIKIGPRQARLAGEHAVVAELLRRGVHDVSQMHEANRTEIHASNRSGRRTIVVKVKTKTIGTWQTTVANGRERTEDPNESAYWILVDIGRDPGQRPDFFVVPEWWIENSIHEVHAQYLAERGGRRARTAGSMHHAIEPRRVEQWRERWEPFLDA